MSDEAEFDVKTRRRQANRHDVELPSGTKVTLRLPRILDCILAGDVPAGVLAELSETDREQATLEQMRANKAFNDRLACAAVIAIEGEDVSLEPEELGDIFPDEADITEIVAYASRSKDFEGKA